MKTSEMTDAALDWAVAKCEGYIDDPESWMYQAKSTDLKRTTYHPSINWAQGGPIIEREKIDRIATNVSGGFTASKKIVELLDDDNFNVRWVHGSGPTPLIAAMRCYVASKLGDEIEIPEELTK